MKKLLFMLFAMAILFVGCQDTTVFQNGIVVKSEFDNTYGYKYRVSVKNIPNKGTNSSHYVLLTDKNYRVGDTIKIK